MSRVEKPWGWYDTLHEGVDYKVKMLCVKKGHKISLQKHKKRTEIWTCVKGHPLVIQGRLQTYMRSQDTVTIAKDEVHRIEAHIDDVLVLELQQGICEEEDIIRLSDDYNRE